MQNNFSRIAALVLAVGLSVPVLAARRNTAAPVGGTYSGVVAWSASEGKPHLKHRRQVGYYVWHEGNTIHIESSGHSRKGEIFAGQIAVQGGTITGTHPVHLETKQDAYRQPTPSSLQFRFDTHEGTDGMVFTVTGGQIAFDFRIQGQPTSRVFVGPNAVEVLTHPVVIDTTR